MVIREQTSVPTVKLPPAKLYLDDLQKIIDILRPEGSEAAPELDITLNTIICDCLEDLRGAGARFGGRTSNFRMEVTWSKPNGWDVLKIYPKRRADLTLSGSAARRISIQAQVQQVFAKRIRWSGKFRWLIIAALVLLWFALFVVVDHFTHKVFGKEGEEHWAVMYSYVGLSLFLLLTYITRLLHSSVVFRNYSEDEGNFFRRHSDQIKLAAVTALIAAVIGSLMTLLIQKTLH